MLAKEFHPSDTQLLNARTNLQADARINLSSLPSPIDLSDPVKSYSPLWCDLFLDDNGNKALVPLRRIPTHLIGPSEIWFILYLLKYLINWLFEQKINHLSPRR